MINIAALRPSDFRKLDEKMSHPGYAAEFAEGLVEYLNEIAVDGGADSDRIYVLALQLTDAKAWNHIDANALAGLLLRAPDDAVAVFLQGLPSNVAPAVGFLLTAHKAAAAPTEPVQVLSGVKVREHWVARRGRVRELKDVIVRVVGTGEIVRIRDYDDLLHIGGVPKKKKGRSPLATRS